ncbi:hypothetical protein G5V58_00820 [Nocardioides anomalus]|uniref:Uncharacterized protein n=1 Tax=Nocardioides anomalus TaxID=2712223 RepID=A0A6G6W8F2_9ACTN|nr:hypothetical protein [Nocardioides anomalus]QIG41504.1 hypothetical protein G5V58_00820 [Nocardioides anomalus]
MTDEQPTQTGDLGEQPEPVTEPGEPNPGGVDALPEDDENVPADLDPDHNPATDEAPEPLQEELEQGEDTGTEATESDGGEHEGSSGDEESPA